MKHYIGIDFGGTFLKGGVVSESGEIVLFKRVKTQAEKGDQAVINNVNALICGLLDEFKGEVLGIGIGIPGLIDSINGVVVTSGNIKWNNVNIVDRLKANYDIPIRISNDANVAALGEAKFGTGKKYSSTVFLTLGTGVGGGIVLNGRLFEGNMSAGSELGHMIIRKGGKPCSCGAKGCYETYASATALIEQTKAEMLKNKESKLWQVGIENIDGKTAFDYEKVDKTAAKVVKQYIENLSVGVINIANIFRPDAVILGGGIAKQGQVLADRVSTELGKYIFAGSKGPKVEVLIASLEEAGVVGAASLVMN